MGNYWIVNGRFYRKIDSNNSTINIMSERKTIYLCLAHMSEDGMEQ